MKQCNELLRSAHEIAKRNGENTNWGAFMKNLEAELVKQAGGDINNKNNLERATCTAKTYRIIRD